MLAITLKQETALLEWPVDDYRIFRLSFGGGRLYYLNQSVCAANNKAEVISSDI